MKTPMNHIDLCGNHRCFFADIQREVNTHEEKTEKLAVRIFVLPASSAQSTEGAAHCWDQGAQRIGRFPIEPRMKRLALCA